MIQSQLFFNKCFDKNKLKGLISWSLRNYGEATTLELVEKLKNVGFLWATQAGISLSIDDLKIPKEKNSLLVDAEKLSHLASTQFYSGNLTTVERLQQLIDAWHRTSENLKQEVVSNFRRTDPLNPVYMMAFSGARGNISQVRQLVGMRGLMADPQGRIIDFPIRSNFREGLTLTEYVISCYGARKGIVDTALRTATSGYLTRRLVDVAQHIVVSNYDCETEQGIPLNPLKQGNKVILPLSERVLGRVLAEDVEGLAPRNTCITQYLASKISKNKETLIVRSPLLCKSKNGVCQLCYGWSLAHNELVSIGEAVGIIAAQSIGEPGTQLTMRTFHTGGVFSGEIIDQIQSSESGIVKFTKPLKGALVRTSYGKIGFLTRESGILTILNSEKTEKIEEISFPLQSILFVRQGQKVDKNETLLEYASSATDQDQGIQATHLVSAPQKGEVFFEDVVVVKDELNTEAQAYQLGSFWLLTSHLHNNGLNLPGTFRYIRRDLLKTEAPLTSTKLLNRSLQISYLNSDVKNSYSKTDLKTKFPVLQSKILDCPIGKLYYVDGMYLTSFLPSAINKNFVSSHHFNSLTFFDKTLISLPSFSKSLKNKFTETKSDLFLVFSTSNFWFLCQNLVPLSLNYSFKKKLFPAYVTRKCYSSETNVKPFSRKIKHSGNYLFKSKFKKVTEFNLVNSSFYTKDCTKENQKFSSTSKRWVSVSNRFSFFDKSRTYQKIRKTNFTFVFESSLVKPILKQFSSALILSFFSRQAGNLPKSSNFLFNRKNSREFELIKLAQKTNIFSSCLPVVSNSYYLTKVLNKQTLDKSLKLTSPFNFELEPFSLDLDSSFFTFQLKTKLLFDQLKWTPDPTSFNTISVFGEGTILVPTKMKQTVLSKNFENNLLQWKPAKRKLFKDSLILGQIDNKTSETREIFKILEEENGGKMLSIHKNDLYTLAWNKKSNFSSLCFLGSLIRPGKEIFANSTIKECGQILSIGKNQIIFRKALPILFSSKANFHVFHGDFIEKGLPLITLTYKRLTTGDIVQGIPRIEQLFEARQTTTVLHEQLHELFETYKTRMRLDLAARKSFQKIQRILIDSIQRVYQSQGVTISDKHLEIIVRQMTSTVRILEGGRTRLLRGELKPIDWIEKINLGIDIQKAEYEPILLGITKASLETESFISAASFQETTRTLSRAAIEGRTDFLRGLKENVILGHRVPAGTGAPLISYLTKFSTESELNEDVSSELNFLLKE